MLLCQNLRRKNAFGLRIIQKVDLFEGTKKILVCKIEKIWTPAWHLSHTLMHRLGNEECEYIEFGIEIQINSLAR